ncbi:helix-turn-helix domain-containing protein [Streptomyces sp. NPDC051133]|uniref:GlxA family transcriptional regulator n=1 Tax=Streptomyces sp. NPDC051133 TaxID=3155521 RepID=UPI0034388485
MLFDGVDLLDVTGPPEVFALLGRDLRRDPGYRVLLAAETADPVTTGAGVKVVPDVTFSDIADRRTDTLIVPGSVTIDRDHRVHPVIDPAVVAWVRKLAYRSRRVTSVCVGAHLLAEAGLLDGKRATTHWSTARQLAARYPAVDVDPDPIFIREGNVWTGAGITACLDLALALVAEDFGEAAAMGVARQLVMYLKRPSGQSQFSVPVEPAYTTRRMDDLRHYVTANLRRRITVAELAAYAHISDRQLTRIFQEETGMTPAVYIDHARVERARNRLEESEETLDRIADACGFGSVATLIRAFRRRLGITPSEYRRRFRPSA